MFVYICGPLETGDNRIAKNINIAIGYADKVLEAGHVPFIPHLTYFWDIMSPKDRKVWLDYDNQILLRCDVVLRIPGKSIGAAGEVILAINKGISVVYSIKELTNL